MANDLNTLHNDLREILEALKKAGGSGSTTPGSSPPKSIKDAFSQVYSRGAKQGLGVEGMLAGKAADIGGMLGKGAGAAGPMGAIIMPLIELGKAMYTLPGKVRDFAEGIHQANRAFASASPGMSMVMMQSDFADMMRKMRQGENLAESASSLSQGRQRLNDALEPVDTARQNMMNNLGSAASNTMAAFLEKSGWADQLGKIFDEVGDTAKKWNEDVLNIEEKKLEDDWIKELNQLERDEEAKRAKRMQPVRNVPGRDPRPNFAHDRRDPGGF